MGKNPHTLTLKIFLYSYSKLQGYEFRCEQKRAIRFWNGGFSSCGNYCITSQFVRPI